LRVEFELKYKDLLMFNAIHQALSVTIHLFYAIAPFMAFYFAEKGEDIVVTSITAVLFYLAAWVIQLAFLAIYLGVGNNRTLLTRKIMELQDGALFEETKYIKALHYWPGIVKAVRRPGYIAIYMSSFTAHVIPNRAFANQTDCDKFWSVLNLKLKSAPVE
jgi:hypothetical protein